MPSKKQPKQPQNYKCLICGEEFNNILNAKKFTDHINYFHKLSTRDYCKIYLGETGKCAEIGCANEPRFIYPKFFKRCKEHQKISFSEGGAKGGKSPKPWGHDIERVKKHSERVSGKGNPFFGCEHSEETKQQIANSKRLTEQEFNDVLLTRINELELLSSYEKDYKYRQSSILKFRCKGLPEKDCNRILPMTLTNFERGTKCRRCYPLSKEQQYLFDFVEAIINDENVEILSDVTGEIKGNKELDIYIPSLGLAIEYGGLFWHSSLCKNPNIYAEYHKDKYKECLDKNIDLIQIFGDEFHYNKLIVESIIKDCFCMYENTIDSINCEYFKLSLEEEKTFFQSNHIKNYEESEFCFGFKFNNEIVSAISFKKSLEPESIDVIRFCNKLNTKVSNSFSELLNKSIPFIKNKGFKFILDYADLRFRQRLEDYSDCGFEFVKETELDWWYTDSHKRYKNTINPEKSYGTIYGTGSNVFRKKI